MDRRSMETSWETRSTIITLYRDGMTQNEIARQLGISTSTVRNWIRRYKTTASVKGVPRLGRPRLTTPEQDNAIVNAVIANPLATPIDIQKEYDLSLSLQTIRNRMLASDNPASPCDRRRTISPRKSGKKREFDSVMETESSSSDSCSSFSSDESEPKKHRTLTYSPSVIKQHNVKTEPVSHAVPVEDMYEEEAEEEEEEEEGIDIKVEVKEEPVDELDNLDTIGIGAQDNLIYGVQGNIIITEVQGGSRSSLGRGRADDNTLTSRCDVATDRQPSVSPVDPSQGQTVKREKSSSSETVAGVLSSTSHTLQEGAEIQNNTTSPNVKYFNVDDSDASVIEPEASQGNPFSKPEESEESDGDDEVVPEFLLYDSDSSCIDSEDESLGRKESMQVPDDIKPLDWNWIEGDFNPDILTFDSLSSGFTADIGITKDSSELDCFLYFFDVFLMSLIARETNNHYKYQRRRTPDNVHWWYDVTISELYVFLGHSILIPHIPNENREQYWKKGGDMSFTKSVGRMTEKRYRTIAKMLHFSNNHVLKDDPLAKVRPVYSFLQDKFSKALVPFRNVMVDESQAMFKTRLSAKLSIPSKHHDYEAKVYVLCDCQTGYVIDFLIYSSAATEGISLWDFHGTSGAIVKLLLKPLYGKGHTLFVGKWCSNPDLFHYLLSKKVGACGMVRPDLKNYPSFGTVSQGRAVAYQANKVLVLMWREKRTILSTVHEWNVRNSTCKPKQWLDYRRNTCKFGISDVQTMPMETRVVKWYKKLFYHLLDLTLLNAYTLFVTKTEKKPKYRDFQLSLVAQIFTRFGDKTRKCDEEMKAQTSVPLRFMLSKGHFPRLLTCNDKTMQKSCHVCTNTVLRSKKNQRTSYYCSVCEVPLCVVPCFESFHTLKHF